MIKITSRYINTFYSFLSFYTVRSGLLWVCPPLPPSVSVELSGTCNLHCPECVTGAGLLKREKKFMDPALAQRIANEIEGHALSAWLYFQGEPMMHPEFFEILEMFRKMKTVISTNGHFLTRENCRKLVFSGLDKIIIPYDAVTDETYGIYRKGGDLKRVSEGIRLLSEHIEKAHSGLKIEIQFLLGRHNEHEADRAAYFARSVNAGFRIKSMQVLDPGRISYWMPSDVRKSRYKEANGVFVPVFSQRKGCWRLWTTAVITVDGDVVPCCFDKNGKHTMGNIPESSFKDIWTNTAYHTFRKAVMKNRKSVEICSSCPQGSRLLY